MAKVGNVKAVKVTGTTKAKLLADSKILCESLALKSIWKAEASTK